MDFEYVDVLDPRGRRYHFHIDEDDLLFVDISTYSDSGELTYKQSVAFIDDVFVWPKFGEVIGVLDSFIPERVQKFCEKRAISFMKMKVFW
jgi:hypothetical protein